MTKRILVIGRGHTEEEAIINTIELAARHGCTHFVKMEAREFRRTTVDPDVYEIECQVEVYYSDTEETA